MALEMDGKFSQDETLSKLPAVLTRQIVVSVYFLVSLLMNLIAYTLTVVGSGMFP